MRPIWLARAGVALAACALALALAEGALRLAGFTYTLAPVVEVGWPDPETLQTRYRPDPDLFWVVREYDERLTAARRDPVDVIFMGDSCTEFGRYPEYTIERLSGESSRPMRGVSLAAGGWSSEQGVAQLERDVLPLAPRVITVYYGWNDHWVALGPTDRQLRRITRHRGLYGNSRLAQLVLKAQVGAARPIVDRPNRVSEADYRENLTRIVERASAAGITAVLLTAPSNHVPGQEPEVLLNRHLRHLDELVPLHNAYVAITRDVARATGAPLCDLAEAFDALPPPRDRYFLQDGIHFTDEGDRFVADVLAACLDRLP